MEKKEESSTPLAQGHQQLTMLLNTPRRDCQVIITYILFFKFPIDTRFLLFNLAFYFWVK